MNDQMQSHVTDFYQNEAHAQQYLKRRMGNLTGQFRHKRQIDLINRLIRQNQLKTAFEIACGPGRITRDIRDIQKGIAVDTSQAMIGILREQITGSTWNFCIADAFKVPIIQQFDLVFTIRFIWHFPLSERAQFYQAVYARLASHGFFVFDALTTNRFIFAPTQNQMYEKRYSKISLLVNELEMHNFEVCSVLGYLNHPNLQHPIAKVGDITGITRPILAVLNVLEKMKAKNSEEYIIVCKKK